jgi:hypothetical protein
MVTRKRGPPAHLTNPELATRVHISPETAKLKRGVSWLEHNPAWKDGGASGAAALRSHGRFDRAKRHWTCG